MHGDMKVSTKELARVMGVKRVVPSNPEAAQRHSGYLVGGTSLFGIEPRAVVRLLKPALVRVAI